MGIVLDKIRENLTSNGLADIYKRMRANPKKVFHEIFGFLNQAKGIDSTKLISSLFPHLALNELIEATDIFFNDTKVGNLILLTYNLEQLSILPQDYTDKQLTKHVEPKSIQFQKCLNRHTMPAIIPNQEYLLVAGPTGTFENQVQNGAAVFANKKFPFVHIVSEKGGLLFCLGNGLHILTNQDDHEREISTIAGGGTGVYVGTSLSARVKMKDYEEWTDEKIMQLADKICTDNYYTHSSNMLYGFLVKAAENVFYINSYCDPIGGKKEASYLISSVYILIKGLLSIGISDFSFVGLEQNFHSIVDLVYGRDIRNKTPPLIAPHFLYFYSPI